MSRRDRLFLGSVAGLTLMVPLPLAWLAPIAEERARLGTLCGWSLALLIMLPSYVLLSRAMNEENPHRFVGAFMTGSILRMSLSLVGVLVFWLAVKPPPVRSFLLTFLSGYVLLSVIEVVLTVRQRAQRPAAERSP